MAVEFIETDRRHIDYPEFNISDSGRFFADIYTYGMERTVIFRVTSRKFNAIDLRAIADKLDELNGVSNGR